MRTPLLNEESKPIPVAASHYSFWQNPKVARGLVVASHVAYLMDGVLDAVVDLSTDAYNFVTNQVPAPIKVLYWWSPLLGSLISGGLRHYRNKGHPIEPNAIERAASFIDDIKDEVEFKQLPDISSLRIRIDRLEEFTQNEVTQARQNTAAETTGESLSYLGFLALRAIYGTVIIIAISRAAADQKEGFENTAYGINLAADLIMTVGSAAIYKLYRCCTKPTSPVHPSFPSLSLNT